VFASQSGRLGGNAGLTGLEDGVAGSEVLIIGAGPTGLVLALWLTKLGAKVRIIDKTAEPGTTSRALAVQARTLELYRQLDLADAIVERGHKGSRRQSLGERRAGGALAFRYGRLGPDAVLLPPDLPPGPA
jgi:2-polyprenyl-6-methoxyphenol hydroxylase-like FAD-dependent oxidoreductase